MTAGARTAVPRVPQPQRRTQHAIELSSLAVALTLLSGTSSGSPGNTADTQPLAVPQISEQAREPLFAAPTRLDQTGRILAPVMINGQGPFRLIVDTGANQSVLTTKLATALGLETSPERTVKLHGVTGSVLVPIVAVDRFETGDLVQLGLELPVINSVMGGAEGVLGMQGFAGKRITVDFVHDRINIEDSRGQRAPRDFITLPATLRFNRLLLVNGEVDGIPVRAVIDTGAQRTLAIEPCATRCCGAAVSACEAHPRRSSGSPKKNSAAMSSIRRRSGSAAHRSPTSTSSTATSVCSSYGD